MLAYHNNPLFKIEILAQIAAHREAYELIKGQYWEDGKGCAIACTLHSADHSEYEDRFGIPEVIARLGDRIFEGLPNELAQQGPECLMSAVTVGSDLSMIWPRFALWLLTEELAPHVKNYPQRATALADVAALYSEWCEKAKPSNERWVAAYDAAYAAYYATYYAAFTRMADRLIEFIEQTSFVEEINR